MLLLVVGLLTLSAVTSDKEVTTSTACDHFNHALLKLKETLDLCNETIDDYRTKLLQCQRNHDPGVLNETSDVQQIMENLTQKVPKLFTEGMVDIESKFKSEGQVIQYYRLSNIIVKNVAFNTQESKIDKTTEDLVEITGVLKTRPFLIDGQFSLFGRDHHRALERANFRLLVYQAVFTGKVIHIPHLNYTTFTYLGLKTAPQFVVHADSPCEGHDHTFCGSIQRILENDAGFCLINETVHQIRHKLTSIEEITL